MNKTENSVSVQEIQAIFQDGWRAHQTGRLADAEAAYRRVLKLNADHADASHLLGLIARQGGNNEAAVELISKAIRVNPCKAAYYNTLGNALKNLGRPDDAITHYQKAVSLSPELFEAHTNLGVALRETGLVDEAIASHRKAIALNPDYAKAHTNLGNALKETGQLEDAAASHEKAILLKPDLAEAHSNLGSVRQEQGRLDEAGESCRKALALNPDYVDALTNLGGILEEQGLLDEAEDISRRAIELKPDFAEAHFNLALILFAKGLLNEAWDEYEWRWRIPKNERTALNYLQPRWDGSPINGKRLLVWSEQGVGDEIRFASMIPDLVEANAHVVLEADPRLVPLFRRSFPDVSFIAKENFSSSESLTQNFDFQIPSGSLGQLFRNKINLFPDRPSYLVADETLRDAIRERYRDGTGDLLVGIAWNSKNKEHGDWKSLSLDELRPLAEISGIKLVDLQYGDTAEERAAFDEQIGHALIHDDEINQMTDLDTFAAQVAALDLVVTISNTTAHVAGALGVQTWVLLNTAPLACWMMDSNDSPWYSSAKLFRQSRPGDWKGVIERVAQELGKLLNS